MALSEASIAQRAFAALVSAGADPAQVKRPNLIALIPDALELLGKRVAESPNCEGLQKSFNITITAGVADLTTLTGVIFDPLKAIVFPPSSTTPAIFLETYEDLVFGPMPAAASEPVYYVQNGTLLRFRNNSDGSLTSLAGTGTITMNYIPSLTDAARPIPDQYESAIVQTVVELAMRKPQEAAEITEAGGRA